MVDAKSGGNISRYFPRRVCCFYSPTLALHLALRYPAVSLLSHLFRKVDGKFTFSRSSILGMWAFCHCLSAHLNTKKFRLHKMKWKKKILFLLLLLLFFLVASTSIIFQLFIYLYISSMIITAVLSFYFNLLQSKLFVHQPFA